jgi:hypothetical protein
VRPLGARGKALELARETAPEDVQAMADALLELFGHDPETVSDGARAGAIIVADHIALQGAFVKGIAAAFGKKGTRESTADRARSRIRR